MALGSFEEGNLANISSTMKVNISTKPEVIEHITLRAYFSLEEVASYKALFQEFRDIFAWSYTEMYGLDPSIVEHRIDTWLDVAPIFQKQRPIHPSKAPSVKAEIEKLCKAGFIYPIASTTWVSNLIPVNKKKGTIHLVQGVELVLPVEYQILSLHLSVELLLDTSSL